MSTFELKLDVDNAAFAGDDLGPELARILRNLADKLQEQNRKYLSGNGNRLRVPDINGNCIGFAEFDIDEPDDDDIHDFVGDMRTEHIRTMLQEHCSIQCYDHETHDVLVDALVECITTGDVSIDDIKAHFPEYDA